MQLSLITEVGRERENGGGRWSLRPMAGNRQALSPSHVFRSHFSLLRLRFSHSLPPPRYFHRISLLPPRRRRQRGRRSPRLFPLFRRFSQGRPCQHPRRLHRFPRSLSLPILTPIPSASSQARPFRCLISVTLLSSFFFRSG